MHDLRDVRDFFDAPPWKPTTHPIPCDHRGGREWGYACVALFDWSGNGRGWDEVVGAPHAAPSYNVHDRITVKIIPIISLILS